MNNMKIIGALFWDYNPICIVIPKIQTHLECSTLVPSPRSI